MSNQPPLPAPLLQNTRMQASPIPPARAFSPQQQRAQSPSPADRPTQPQQPQSPSVFNAFGPAQNKSPAPAQPQRPPSPSILDSLGGTQSASQPYTQSQWPQSNLGFDAFSQPQSVAQPAPQTRQYPVSLLDDPILPPNQESQAKHAQQQLQHTQSLPKAPLYPNTKAASAKRFTDPPQASIPVSTTTQSTHQPSFQPQGTPAHSFLGASNANPFDVSSSAPILPVMANPFATPSFGDLSLARPSAPVLRTRKADVTPSGSPSSSPTKADGRGQQQHDAPLSFDARLSPLHPKLSAPLTLLAAVHGSLFAGPSSHGGLLQWARPEGNMRQPSGSRCVFMLMLCSHYTLVFSSVSTYSAVWGVVLGPS